MSPNPSALTLTHALDLDDARQAARQLAQQRIRIREELEERRQEWKRLQTVAAEKKRDYRKAKALAFVAAQGRDASERRADAEQRAADPEFEADLADRMVKVQYEAMQAKRDELEEVDGERASLHRLMEWSLRLDPDANWDGRTPNESAIGARR